MLRNEDMTDREVLALVKDCLGPNDLAASSEIADRLGVKDDDRAGRASVSRRLSWMRRYGWLAYNEDERAYALTDSGRALLNGKLRASMQRALEDLSPGERVLLMRGVASGLNSVSTLTAVRREWQHQYARFRRD